MKSTADLYVLMEAFPPQSPAWCLVDAFDAVTNGMENPEALQGMELLSDPWLEPWKHLIRGIRALYAGDRDAAAREVEAIDDGAAPAVLRPFFRAWFARQTPAYREESFQELSEATGPVVSLFQRILIEPHPLTLLAAQAEEALRHDLVEQAEQIIFRILGTLREQGNPLLTLRYAMYCLILLDQRGRGDTDFFTQMRGILGDADGFCALGFTLLGRDNAAASAALDRALKARDGRFLDAAMASLIAVLVSILRKDAQASAVPKGSPGVLGKRPVQLDLFGGAHE